MNPAIPFPPKKRNSSEAEEADPYLPKKFCIFKKEEELDKIAQDPNANCGGNRSYKDEGHSSNNYYDNNNGDHDSGNGDGGNSNSSNGNGNYNGSNKGEDNDDIA
ncbi:hypothetical protein B0H14DRAFT_2633021 [Mycena olivaceomarginata]|nr:hypothetical protein B0H14DRAFT_2633021 [Mycena olivaceomarginata]